MWQCAAAGQWTRQPGQTERRDDSLKEDINNVSALSRAPRSNKRGLIVYTHTEQMRHCWLCCFYIYYTIPYYTIPYHRCRYKISKNAKYCRHFVKNVCLVNIFLLYECIHCLRSSEGPAGWMKTPEWKCDPFFSIFFGELWQFLGWQQMQCYPFCRHHRCY